LDTNGKAKTDAPLANTAAFEISASQLETGKPNGPDENIVAKVLQKLQVFYSPLFARIALTIALYLKSRNVVKADKNRGQNQPEPTT
jgi:pantothenate kinase-related protein Tda10